MNDAHVKTWLWWRWFTQQDKPKAMTEPTPAQIDALQGLFPGYEQYLEWCKERRVLFLQNGYDNLAKAKSAIAALTAAAAVEPTNTETWPTPFCCPRCGSRGYVKDGATTITAAAEVGTDVALCDYTIERCAQVADGMAYVETCADDTAQGTANAAPYRKVAVAIRALKDKP